MNSLYIILSGMAGALLTFYLNNHMKLGAVRASALPSFVVALFFYLFPELLPETLTQQLPAVVIGASFIGMVSGRVVNHFGIIALSGAVFGFIFLNTSTFFTGYGGALGTVACISLVVAMSLPVFFSKHRLKNGFTLLQKRLFGNK